MLPHDPIVIGLSVGFLTVDELLEYAKALEKEEFEGCELCALRTVMAEGDKRWAKVDEQLPDFTPARFVAYVVVIPQPVDIRPNLTPQSAQPKVSKWIVAARLLGAIVLYPVLLALTPITAVILLVLWLTGKRHNQ